MTGSLSKKDTIGFGMVFRATLSEILRLRPILVLLILGGFLGTLPVAINARAIRSANIPSYVATWEVLGGRLLMTCQNAVSQRLDQLPLKSAQDGLREVSDEFKARFGTTSVYYCYLIPMRGLPEFRAEKLRYLVGGNSYIAEGLASEPIRLRKAEAFYVALPETENAGLSSGERIRMSYEGSEGLLTLPPLSGNIGE